MQGKTFNSVLRERFWCPPKPVLWMHLVWTCGYKLPVFSGFFSEELVTLCSLWCLSAVLQVLWSSSKLSSSGVFSAAFKHLDCVGSCQCSEGGATDTSPWGSSLRNWNIGRALQLFPSSERDEELGNFSHSFCTELRGGAMVSECVVV